MKKITIVILVVVMMGCTYYLPEEPLDLYYNLYKQDIIYMELSGVKTSSDLINFLKENIEIKEKISSYYILDIWNSKEADNFGFVLLYINLYYILFNIKLDVGYGWRIMEKRGVCVFIDSIWVDVYNNKEYTSNPNTIIKFCDIFY